MYDYLIVGAGPFGTVFAYEAEKRGKKVLLIDKRSHTGGNMYCETIEGITVHSYGAHIFHTSNTKIWKYVNQFCDFNHYINSPIARYNNEIYNLPFNMNTFNKMWGVITPQEARNKIREQIESLDIQNPQNLEEQALSLVGTDIYMRLIKGYTEKQWGCPATELPAFIIKRLPVRFIYDNNYFNDRYQGIPVGGYNVIFDAMLKDIEVRLNTDYFSHKDELDTLARKIIFTGPIDKFFAYKLGVLDYRSLRFETEVLDIENYQGNAVVNYTHPDVPFTRIIEHKHFDFGKQENTVITHEYPAPWDKDVEPYYPVNDSKNSHLYNEYKEMARKRENVIFGGRLGSYKYYDMHLVFHEALKAVDREFSE